MIFANPLVGVGLNNYRDTMTKYDETGIFLSRIFPNPVRNMFAHVAAETGIGGGIVFCLLIAAALFANWQHLGDRDRLLTAISLAVFAGLLAFIISAVKEPGSLGSAHPPMTDFVFSRRFDAGSQPSAPNTTTNAPFRFAE